MTSLTLHTPATSVNSLLAMPALSSFGKKNTTNKNFISYTATSKSWYKKTAAKRSSSDWDMNSNELEFE